MQSLTCGRHVMEFKGKYSLPATPDRVWQALHDPAALSASIPGCENLEKISDSEYRATATLKIGPVKARFQGKVALEDVQPPPGVAHAMVLTGEGQGGAAGFARGKSEVQLSRDGEKTLLEYSANAIVGGKLAQIGQRLIDGAAKSIADDFFARFSALMQPPVPETTAPAAKLNEDRPPAGVGLAPQIWVAGLIGIIVILLVFFSIVL
jgi:carbon monoxide dehydrogenase subunit G